MTSIILLLAAEIAAAIGIRYLWKPVRYSLARYLRKYANWISPDNF